jgi:hypothetical protein
MASKEVTGTKVLAVLVQKQKLTTSARAFKPHSTACSLQTHQPHAADDNTDAPASNACSTQLHAAFKRINRMQLTTSAPHAALNRMQLSNACSTQPHAALKRMQLTTSAPHSNACSSE